MKVRAPLCVRGLGGSGGLRESSGRERKGKKQTEHDAVGGMRSKAAEFHGQRTPGGKHGRHDIVMRDSSSLLKVPHLALVQKRGGSMKVVRTDFNIGDVQGSNELGLDVEHAVLVLERAFDTHETAARDHDAILLKHVGCEDDVGNACFILKGQENEALGGAWAWSCDDTTSNADELMVRESREVIG